MSNQKKQLETVAFFVLNFKTMSFYKECRKEQKRFYSSTKWIRCRDVYLSEHPLCERCLEAGRASTAEHVHHKIELNINNYKDPMIALNPDNLEALCFECHQKEHHESDEVDKDLYFDTNGNLCSKIEAEQRGAGCPI